MKKRQLFLVVTIFLLAVTSVWAEPIVNVIYYQKQTLLSYHPAVNRLFRFSLWLEETGGVGPVWSEEKHYTMTNSFVKTYLGSVNPLNGVDFSQQLWVGVEMKKLDGTYVLIGPRTRLGVTPSGVVPYAINALNGPAGPQGPPGVANGITRGVYGRVSGSGEITSGTGFDCICQNGWCTNIHFHTPFTKTPTCTATIDYPGNAPCNTIVLASVTTEDAWIVPSCQVGYSFICVE